MNVRLRVLAVAGILAGTVLVGAGTARAADAVTVDDAGWWSRSSLDPAVGGLGAPDVADDQLLVEGTPEGATALAAFRATVPPGTASPVLSIVPDSAVGLDAASVFLACQAGSGWTGVQGGAWTEHPNPDCSASVQGIVGDDGSVTFALAPLQFDDQLNVVLVPGVDPAGADGVNGSTFRVVFPVPVGDDIVVSAVSAPAPTDPPVTTAPPLSAYTPPPRAPIAPPTTTRPVTFSVPTAPTAQDLASQPARAALPTEEQGRTATAPILTAASPAILPAPAPSRWDGRWFGVVLVLCGGAALVLVSRQPLPERQVLSRFVAGGSAAAVVGPSPAVADIGGGEPGRLGGLGRFRRERDTPARRLGT